MPPIPLSKTKIVPGAALNFTVMVANNRSTPTSLQVACQNRYLGENFKHSGQETDANPMLWVFDGTPGWGQHKGERRICVFVIY